jgi:hypothetical protein
VVDSQSGVRTKKKEKFAVPKSRPKGEVEERLHCDMTHYY